MSIKAYIPGPIKKVLRRLNELVHPPLRESLYFEPKQLPSWCIGNVCDDLSREGKFCPKYPEGLKNCSVHSSICAEEDFRKEWFHSHCKNLSVKPYLHRKLWELCWSAQALEERGYLKEGKAGIGFGVGREPLVAYFASKGVDIVATDLAADEATAGGWIGSKEHALKGKDLNSRGLCDERTFFQKVRFEAVNMNSIPRSLAGRFDFSWSCCSLEHVGSLRKSIDFLINQMDCLKPGGLAVHTTEFNLSSNAETISEGPTVIFRKCDIELLQKECEARGYLLDVDFRVGKGTFESLVDLPPYRQEIHLRLQFEGYDCTSIGLIIQKPL